LGRGATRDGPLAFANAAIEDDAQLIAIAADSPAAEDVRAGAAGFPLHIMPTKLGALAAGQLSAMGTLLTAKPPRLRRARTS
jgi:hypothetical protein